MCRRQVRFTYSKRFAGIDSKNQGTKAWSLRHPTFWAIHFLERAPLIVTCCDRLLVISPISNLSSRILLPESIQNKAKMLTKCKIQEFLQLDEVNLRKLNNKWCPIAVSFSGLHGNLWLPWQRQKSWTHNWHIKMSVKDEWTVPKVQTLRVL